MKSLPDLKHEVRLWEKGYTVLGVDEVGRGALAGPVTVGVVCFSSDSSESLLNIGIDDSKRISPKRREELATIIKETALCYATASTPVGFINNHGIVKATQRAIREAVACVKEKIGSEKIFLLADAFYIKHVRGVGLKNQNAIIHGDQISLSIAAASIIAKVERDEHMRTLSKKFPKYLWDCNKGYGTKEHLTMLSTHGKTRYHRELYIKKILN